MKTKTYFAVRAGSITTKIKNDKQQFLIAERVKWNDYVLPAGHVRKDESLEEASVRETLEETGYPTKAGTLIDSYEYFDEKHNPKNTIRRTYFFHNKVVGEKTSTQNPDEQEGKTVAHWFSYKEAIQKLSDSKEKEMLKKFDLISKTTQ